MIKTIEKILKNFVCDSCLGRQFGQLLTGYSNKERGRILRALIAMKLDSGEKLDVDLNNFYNYRFRFNRDLIKAKMKKKKCYVCDDFFEKIDKFVKKITRKLEKYEFNTFLIGTILSKELLKKEESLWEAIGIDYCEPIKAEINREIGKRLEKLLKRKADMKNPDITILLDLEKNKIKLQINSLYVFGYYQKLVRGIPQSKWTNYKTSVEQIIGKPFLKQTKGKGHKMHGSGREDVNAKCLGWRPFVIEILEPKKRKIGLKKIQKEINKKVKVKSLKFSDINTVRKIKELKPDKTYRVLVKLDKAIDRKDLKILKNIVGVINQKTPKRVSHRRGVFVRKRKVRSIKSKFINSKTVELIIKGESGLYIKELISGDENRTKPSVSELLNRKAVCKELDVVKIEKIKV